MSFYTDVPHHEWKIFGSYADGEPNASSDFDVILCGVNRKDLEDVPYFADLMPKLLALSVDRGKSLDLFIDDPGEHRLLSAFSERSIDGGEDVYRAIHSIAKTTTVIDVLRRSAFLSHVDRAPITSKEQFYEGYLAKQRRMEELIAKLPPKENSLPSPAPVTDSQMTGPGVSL